MNKDFEHIGEILERVLDNYGLREKLDTIIKKDGKPFLSLDELVEYTGLSKFTLYALVNRGVLPHYKPTRRLYFSKEEIDAWILNRNNRNKTNSENFF